MNSRKRERETERGTRLRGEDRFRGWIPTRFPSEPRLLISECPKSNVESRHSDVGENTNFTLPETSFRTSFVIFLGDDAGVETKFSLIKWPRFRMEGRIARRLIKIFDHLFGYSLNETVDEIIRSFLYSFLIFLFLTH